MRIAAVLLIAATCLASCASDGQAQRDRHGHWRNREIKEGPPELVQEARREASRRCGPTAAERRRGTDGSQAADYDCGSMRKK
jgi:hypothetical protein